MRTWGACLLVLALAGCGGGKKETVVTTGAASTPAVAAVQWPAPPNPMQLTRKAGLVPETHEFLKYHVHSHLDIFVNGTPVVVPAGIGIDIDNPAVHSGTAPRRLACLRQHRSSLRGTVHLAAAHPLRGRDPSHGVEDHEAEQPRPVLRRMGRPPDPEVRRRLLQAEGADRDLRGRQQVHRRSACDRA